MAKKKIALNLDNILEKYTAEEQQQIDLEVLEKFIATIIELQIKRKSITSKLSPVYSMRDSNGLAYPTLRLYGGFEDLGLFLKVGPCGSGMSIIFKKLKERFITAGLDGNEALKKANFVLKEFYQACQDLKDEGHSPMFATLYYYKKQESGQKSMSTPTSE